MDRREVVGVLGTKGTHIQEDTHRAFLLCVDK